MKHKEKDSCAILEDLKESLSEWPGANVYYRKDWECDYFNVTGKFFCLSMDNPLHGPIVTIKGLPADNELLREQYEFVIPGYHVNKTHWNSIKLSESTFSLEELRALLKHSYELVVAGLSKKVRQELSDREVGREK
ncbi:hypothetical protein CBF29_01135 [Vagococcus elongatus]|uniref:DNA-binding protein n=2 Tax=Vagococcus elongatus TaxID=180344 RepID=A0A430B645_9ENTE|nr:hypothetical protein CBF29_01135 [Vagococcus elongatus]